MTIPIFEDEPEHVGPIQLILEDVISALSNIAPITYYQIERLGLPNKREAYTLDIHIQDQEPMHIYFAVKPEDHHPTFGLLCEKILRFAERQNQMRALLDVSLN